MKSSTMRGGVQHQRSRRGRTRPPVAFVVLAGIGAALFVLPLVAMLVRAPWGNAWSIISEPQIREALRLSLICSLSATALSFVFGVPLAWVQSRVTFRGRSVLRAVTTLPVVLPPVVGGLALLLAVGRNGIVGRYLFDWFSIRLPFTTAGAIVAETFVSMPFLVLSMEGAFANSDTRLEEAASTLGASRWTVFIKITLPGLRPALIASGVLCWARALGEFGATITFAGNFPGTTQTVPLSVYQAFETNPPAAIMLSLLLVFISLLILMTLRHRLVVRT
jgi:molybdate transport system permease protein